MLNKMDVTYLLFFVSIVHVATSEKEDGDWNIEENEVDHDATYDCNGYLGECYPPQSCQQDFNDKCSETEGRCCPEPRNNFTAILPFGTATNCKDRKCKTYYGGWWSASCKPGARTLFYCQARSVFCCGSACRITNKCQRLGGHCVTLKNRCSGAVIKSGCRGKQCFCCIPAITPPPLPTCPMNGKTGESCTGHRSCADHFLAGSTSSGVYTICPISTCNPVLTYCDMESEGGMWTVFVSRDDEHEEQEDFSRVWNDYKEGFGSCDREYWIGNEILYNLTNTSPQKLYLQATDVNGLTKTSIYENFHVGDENSGYQLSVSGYNSSASTLGEILTSDLDKWYDLDGMKFSTIDVDNDFNGGMSCATTYNGGGGFWYNACAAVGPTNNDVILCYFWNDGVYAPVALKKIMMAIRPK